MRHLTWRGRVSWVYYRLRGVFIEPAPPAERCFMGAPVGPDVHCPRYAIRKDVGMCLWCKHHNPKEAL